jgi:hypothetical protein
MRSSFGVSCRPANEKRFYEGEPKMDEFDVLVFLVVLAIGLLIIPSHYDPLKFFLYSRRIFDELTAGISERDFGRIIHTVRTVRED